MIGIVVVSHSPALAQAAVDLALEMGGQAPPEIRIAAGSAGGATGTDALAIAGAIDELASADGVLVLMDLGSAILSAEMALEFARANTPVRLCDAPFLEGLITAVVLAGSGASLDTVDAEASRALHSKISQLTGAGAPGADRGDSVATETDPGRDTAADPDGAATGMVGETPAHATFTGTVHNPSGLHARPAAVFVKTVGRHDARVTVTNVGTGKGPASGASLVSLMSLGVRQGAQVRVDASGPEAATVISELERLLEAGFGET